MTIKANSKLCKTSKMRLFVKVVIDFRELEI